MKYLIALLFLAVLSGLHASEALPGISVHDPVMIREKGIFYIFATGPGVAVWSSPDRIKWSHEKPVFATPPPWAVAAVPGFHGHIWAPDISFYNGQYYLYYAVSAFGKNTSCIGVATNPTLDPHDARFHWEDHGKVIQSIPGQNNWNAIDPNLVADEQGVPYLVFGSFWEGLKLVRLTQDRLHVDQPIDSLPTLASRTKIPGGANPPAPRGNPADAGGNAIEAPFIFKRGNYYYLFASIDYCCRGPASNYKMIVGRAEKLTGPYRDENNNLMARGGGNLLLAGNVHWYGVGHCAVCDFDGVDYLIFHGYDAADQGKSKLRIEQLLWDREDWPRVSAEAAAR